MNYAPHPLEAYFLAGVPKCPFRTMHDTGNIAAWNLYWMSDPQVDMLPGMTDWYGRFEVNTVLIRALVAGAGNDAVLQGHLLESPFNFHRWFKTSHRACSLFRELGRGWAETVLIRSKEAAERTTDAGVVSREGNIIGVRFGPR